MSQLGHERHSGRQPSASGLPGSADTTPVGQGLHLRAMSRLMHRSKRRLLKANDPLDHLIGDAEPSRWDLQANALVVWR